MTSTPMSNPRVVPAQLSYLAIYNPSLGPTDETLRDQIVFYYSHKLEVAHERRKKDKGKAAVRPTDGQANVEGGDDDEEAEANERLRQVGLAQGMVDFVK